MRRMELIAPCHFGLEAVLKREIIDLGYEISEVEDGRVTFIGPRCRYTPTCSQYAQTAIERYGAVKGARLAAWRVLRCNPFSKGGYDPVPEDPCTTLRKE